MTRASPVYVANCLAIAVVVAVSGCTDTALDTPKFVASDSAGIRIVVNEGARWGPDQGWSLSPEPQLEIGVVEGDRRIQFSSVRGVRRLLDGRLVVLDGVSAELRFFDSDGSFLGHVGGPGRGPGEFDRPTGLIRTTGDSLVVVSTFDQEASWFDSRGDFIRRNRLDNATLAEVGRIWGCPERPGLLPDATYLACVGEGAQRDQHPGVPRVSHLLVRTPYDVSWADTLGTFYATGRGLNLAARSSIVAAGGDPLRIFVGDPAFFEIEVFGDRAGRMTSIRYPKGLRPIGQSERSAFAAHMEQIRAAGTSLPEIPPGEIVTQQAVPEIFPSTMPGFSGLHYDLAGNIWAVEFTAPWEERASALVFTEEGELLGRIELPLRFEIHEIGTDYVLGVWRNELEVEFIRIYGLLRA